MTRLGKKEGIGLWSDSAWQGEPDANNFDIDGIEVDMVGQGQIVCQNKHEGGGHVYCQVILAILMDDLRQPLGE